ncbi:MAG: hypothetical protein IJZ59_02800 [Alphaproteobacteria bacterium]|nr:hypothetical protein [Alphaproteobacteria bacterium]
MSMYPQYKSKSGYYINNDGIDSYGVNHKNFTTRDELEYQFARVEREKLNNDYEHKRILYAQNNNPNVMSDIDKYRSISDNNLDERQRIMALKNGQHLKLNIKNNDKANYNWPWYTLDWLGKYYVNKYSDSIEKYANKYNISPDIVKAIMYNEAATGHKGGANNLADLFSMSGSQMPMNIQGKTWGNFQGKYYDTYDAEQNIELGVRLIKQLYGSIDNPTPDKIGTLWNDTGAYIINNVGARVKTAYETKPWEEK